jgi:tetratricopeptide (TPR) repeat protein
MVIKPAGDILAVSFILVKKIGRFIMTARFWLLLSVSLLLLNCFLSGCGEGIKPAERPPLSAESQKKMELLERIDDRYEDPEAHYELGKMYFSDGMYEKAIFHFTTAISFDPVYPEAQAALVNTLLAEGEQTKGVQMAEFYLDKSSDSAEESFLLGRAFALEGLERYELMAYKQALALAPDSALINKQMGFYYLANKDYLLAEQYLRRSFEIDPYQADIAGELGKMGVIVQTGSEDNQQVQQGDTAEDFGVADGEQME